ncbi:MAG: hypothetical protein AB1733_10715 [Thermodesulfobacteriota bacterium]
MDRFRFAIAVLAVVVCLPGLATGQGIPYSEGCGSFGLGGVQVLPSVRVGYQHLALNLNIPVPFSGSFGEELATQSELDFKLQDGGVWIGAAQVEARRDRYSAFLSAEANAPKNVRILTASDPFWYGTHPVEWRGSRLEWWALDGGGGIDLNAALAVVGGLRLEHLSVGLADPVDPTGIIQAFQAIYNDQYAGDFLTKTWLPYVGIRTVGQYYRGLLRFSPVVFADAKIPLRYRFVNLPTNVAFEEADYTFKRSGLWIEGSFDSDVQVSTNFRWTLWLKGSWLQVRGTGREGYRLDNVAGGVATQLLDDSGSASGSYTSYVLAVGMSGVYGF